MAGRITGNIINIETKVGDMAKFASGAANQNLTAEQSAALSAVFNRLGAKVYLAIKMIDVQTGRVLFHKNYTGTASTSGDTGAFRKEHYYTTTKEAIKNAITETEFDLAKQFPTSAQILQTRGAKSIALISAGINNGVKVGDTFDVMQIEKVSGVESKYRVATITVSDQLFDNQAWGFVDGAKEKVRAGMSVQRVIKKQEDPMQKIWGQFR